MIFPFIIMFLAGNLTKPDDKNALDRFFVKMRTKVHLDRKEDERQMQLSYENPARLDHLKLFPKSNWEFQKWDKVDTIGFLISLAVAVGIVGFLYLVVNIGR